MAAFQQVVAWLRGRRGAILALSILWVVVIVAGAGPPADSARWVGIPPLDWLSYVLFACMVIGVVVIVIAIVLAPKQNGPAARPRRSIWPMVLLVLLFVLLSQRDPRVDGDPAAPVVPPIEVGDDGGELTRGTGSLDRDEVGVILLILAAAIGVVALSRRRLSEEQVYFEPTTMDEALTPAVERAADHLRLGSDPRSAVLLAYDGLETTLNRLNRGRSPSETPAEHLNRVLGTMSIDTEPLLQLAELYQVARFSTHPITVDDQRRAAAALQRARAELVGDPQPRERRAGT
ncbi:MAG: DUF4129 domain-containing protein [Acidimicrobiales bacterium]